MGTGVELFDGSGELFTATITDIGRFVEAEINGNITPVADSGPEIVVYQGILKGEKMDLVVQKCTELGVSVLQPLRSSRCQGKFDSRQEQKKIERWQRISLAACKQCGRTSPLKILPVVEFPDAISAEGESEDTVRLMFWEEEQCFRLNMISGWRDNGRVVVMLGPEGGFSGEEAGEAEAAGWQKVNLGSRILRAETATLAAVAIIQHLCGHM